MIIEEKYACPICDFQKGFDELDALQAHLLWSHSQLDLTYYLIGIIADKGKNEIVIG